MFGGVFNSETPFWQGVARIADIVLLNLYFVLTAWPIVTAGASLAALYDCSWRLQDDRGGGTTKMYFRSFAANFGRATAIWAVVGPVGIALGCAWIFLPIAELTVIKTVLTLAYLLVLPYFFYLEVRFENTYGNTLKNALLIPLTRLPWALGVLAVEVALIALVVVTGMYQPALLAPLLLGGVAMIVYATIPLLNRTIQPWLSTPPIDDAGDNAAATVATPTH